MILKCKLSKQNETVLALLEGEKLMYAAPTDVGEDGNWLRDSVTAVTDRRIVVITEGRITFEAAIADVEDVTAEPYIGCGILIVKMNGEENVVARFSSRHLSRYAYIARGARLILSGSDETVVGREPEKTCPKCGRALPGTMECPHCSGKALGFLYEMIRLMQPYKLKLVVVIILMLAATAVSLLSPYLQRILVDDILKDRHGTFQAALVVLGGMLLLNLGILFVNNAKSYMCTELGANMSADLRRKLYYKLQTLSLSFIHERQPGELMNRILNDTRGVQNFMTEIFCDMVTIIIMFVVDVVVMLSMDAKLALVAFAFGPVAVIISMSFRKFVHRRFHMQWVKSDIIHNNLQDVLSGMAVVKSYGKEKDETVRFNSSVHGFAKVQSANEVFWAVFFPAMQFCVGMGVYLVILIGGNGVLKGDKTIGELMQFVSYTSMLFQYIGWLTNLPRMLMDMITSLDRIGDVLNQEPGIYDRENAVSHRINGEIEFSHASFGYKSYKPVLEDINLKVHKGEMIGLVGASGTGKSTLINLIMHLYEVDNGEILIDGINIRDIKLEEYHSQIGVVLQETFLFSGTILNNIRFAKPEATTEEIIRAAKMANAHDFILRTPDGYNTYVGEKGYNLSGGERQRIAIARAILADPGILILDEATASLDTESEYLIQKALERLTAGRTTFAIAHRLSTLKDADRLVVIDDHHIAEVGTHNELMEKNGIYAGLVNAQLIMSGMKEGHEA